MDLFNRKEKRERRQFMINRVDHSPGSTSVELVPIRYDGIKAHRLRAGDVVEVAELKQSTGRIRRGDPLEGEE